MEARKSRELSFIASAKSRKQEDKSSYLTKELKAISKAEENSKVTKILKQGSRITAFQNSSGTNYRKSFQNGNLRLLPAFKGVELFLSSRDRMTLPVERK